MKDDHALIEPSRLLLELQKISNLNQSLSNCLNPQEIARKITDGLVEQFNCSFARIWLVNPEQTALRLISSSGMYTHIDGDFATVPMGAYKVGKIAQHCIPFLSNSLAEESWVKDRQWAIANKICGFAGLPLAISEQAIGVLAVFSHQPMNGEFLEALRVLCSSVAVALKNAQLYQKKLTQIPQVTTDQSLINKPLSEQISDILNNIRLILVGTERSLDTSIHYLLLKTAEALKVENCTYCRLTYAQDYLYLSAMLSSSSNTAIIRRDFSLVIAAMGGNLQSNSSQTNIIQVKLSLPYDYQPITHTLLSHREQEVIQLLAKGMRDREIAQKLFISDRTVKFHINNVVSDITPNTNCKQYGVGFYPYRQPPWLPWLAEVPA